VRAGLRPREGSLSPSAAAAGGVAVVLRLWGWGDPDRRGEGPSPRSCVGCAWRSRFFLRRGFYPCHLV